MDWNEDPFEDIVNSFFGGRPQRRRAERFTESEEEERNIDFVETNDFTYLVFEIPGFFHAPDQRKNRLAQIICISAVKPGGVIAAAVIAVKMNLGFEFRDCCFKDSLNDRRDIIIFSDDAFFNQFLV